MKTTRNSIIVLALTLLFGALGTASEVRVVNNTQLNMKVYQGRVTLARLAPGESYVCTIPKQDDGEAPIVWQSLALYFERGRNVLASPVRYPISKYSNYVSIFFAGTAVIVYSNDCYAFGSARQEFIVTMDSGNSRNIRLLTNMPQHAEMFSQEGMIYNLKPTTITISAPPHSAAAL